MFFNGSGLARIKKQRQTPLLKKGKKMRTSEQQNQVTYYRHGSGISNQIGKKYCPTISEITLSISDIKIGVKGQYYAYVSDGVVCMKADSPESVLKFLKQSLEEGGWVINKRIAEKRAERLAELRNSGELKMAGPNFKKEKYDQCMALIMEIKS